MSPHPPVLHCHLGFVDSGTFPCLQVERLDSLSNFSLHQKLCVCVCVCMCVYVEEDEGKLHYDNKVGGGVVVVGV